MLLNENVIVQKVDFKRDNRFIFINLQDQFNYKR